MATAPKVLIVGGGPSGLMLAICLSRNGIPVRIIEKNSSPRIGQRGAGIMPRSLELFTFLRIADRVLDRAIPVPIVRKYDPSGIQPIQEFYMHPPQNPTPSHPFLNPVMLGQDRLEEIFHVALAELGCTVEFGTELEFFEQSEDHVEAKLRVKGVEETASFEYLVGADGARGIVRKHLGLTFLGETRSVENFVVGDIRVEGLSSKYWHMWGDATSIMVGLRGTEEPKLFSFVIAGKDICHTELANNPDQLRILLAENTSNCQDLEFGECQWISAYTPNIRMVDKFGVGRVFLVGDSAHVHSPTGGQGMNTGMQDSFNLAWKLALVIKKFASPKLLETYTEERVPVVAEMLNLTTKVLKSVFEEGEEKPWDKDTGFLQLGIHYRWSSIVLDQRRHLEARQEAEDDDYMAEYEYIHDQHNDVEISSYGRLNGPLRAGDRAPNASGLVDCSASALFRTTYDLFQIFGSDHHTVLIFSQLADPVPVIQFLRTYPVGMVRSVVIAPCNRSVPDLTVMSSDMALQDEDGHAHDVYIQGRTCGIIVVRPDGVVGAIVRDRRWLFRYFSGIFTGEARKSEPASSIP